ncbi:hypothetical protein KIN20_014335 [Parelaphostrongylus tenuis]|uniref:Uncharacterized protein n=1 Tax=Parelaphostrongylus tenuis TaxID=148309 RepID=A0AAD5QP86_PARTN|nr:hypothetical protein KIN20_014335 [Parelaphostrongylus tenuis]
MQRHIISFLVRAKIVDGDVGFTSLERILYRDLQKSQPICPTPRWSPSSYLLKIMLRSH